MDEQVWKMWYKYTMEYYSAERREDIEEEKGGEERKEGGKERPTLMFSSTITS